MRFVGVHLSGSEKNLSTIALLEGDELGGSLIAVESVKKDDEVLSVILNFMGAEPAFVAIDAPLIVPQKGTRKSQEDIEMLFGQYDVVVKPVSRQSLKKQFGRVRGPELVALLSKVGVSHEPHITAYERSLKCFEVSVQTAAVATFRLDKAIALKSSSLEKERLQIARYQLLLRKLLDVRFPKGLMTKKAGILDKAELAIHRDVLDVIMCSYTAYTVWKNPKACAVLGSMRQGYILTPTIQADTESFK